MRENYKQRDCPKHKTSHHVQGKQPTTNNKKEMDEEGF